MFRRGRGRVVLMTPGMIRCYLIVFKTLAVLLTVPILVLSALPPKDLTVDHIWGCHDSPENGCAILMIVPILWSTLILVVLIGGIVLVAIDITNRIVIWVDIALAVLASLVWFCCVIPAVYYVSFNLKLPATPAPMLGNSTSQDEGAKTLAGLNTNWTNWCSFGHQLIEHQLDQLVVTVGVFHLSDAGMRWRQYVLMLCLQSGGQFPVPYLDEQVQYPGAFAPSGPLAEQKGPIESNQDKKEEQPIHQ